MDMRKIVAGVFVSVGTLGLVGCGDERVDVERVSDVEIRTVTATPSPVTVTESATATATATATETVKDTETVTPKPVKVTETVEATATETVTATPAPETVTATVTATPAPATVTATATETVSVPVKVTETATATVTPKPVRVTETATPAPVRSEPESVPVEKEEGSVWDALAECESGGDWSIVSADGRFHGGVQFHPVTWEAMGGQEYAVSADRASREEQIIVAERVLEVQGWKAWPACSAELGLR